MKLAKMERNVYNFESGDAMSIVSGRRSEPLITLPYGLSKVSNRVRSNPAVKIEA